MNDTEDTTQSGDWTVEPPRKTRRGRKALRIALIVAAVGAAAAGAMVLIGRKIKDDFQKESMGVFGKPVREKPLLGVLEQVPRSNNEGDAL